MRSIDYMEILSKVGIMIISSILRTPTYRSFVNTGNIICVHESTNKIHSTDSDDINYNRTNIIYHSTCEYLQIFRFAMIHLSA